MAAPSPVPEACGPPGTDPRTPAAAETAAETASAETVDVRAALDGELTRRLRVVSVAAGIARLEAPRAPACGTCGARAGCGAAAIAGLSAPLVVELPAEPDMKPGDEAIVAFPAETFYAAMLTGWLLPPAALVGTAGVAAALGLPDGVSALLCLPVFALSLWPLRRAERRGRMAAALRLAPGRAP